ncbi:MAG: hypothetical protein R2748_02640 [Bryobacterales bacterium]
MVHRTGRLERRDARSAAGSANCWEPSVAVDSKDNLFVGFDCYGPNGYDVFVRGLVNGAWGTVKPVAATARFEAYVTLAADADDRIWMAWHESGVNWGKDYGYPFDITANGTGLYASREIRMAVLEGDRLQAPSSQTRRLISAARSSEQFLRVPADRRRRRWPYLVLLPPPPRRATQRLRPHPGAPCAVGSLRQLLRRPGLVADDARPYSTGRNDMRIEIARDPSGRLVAAWPTDRRNFRDFVNMLPDVFTARMPQVAAKPKGLSSVRCACRPSSRLSNRLIARAATSPPRSPSTPTSRKTCAASASTPTR